jgi:hypothetical protein
MACAVALGGRCRGLGGGACLTAPVIFARGAERIVSMKVYARDGNAADYERFSLHRMRPRTCQARQLGSVTTVDSPCRAYNMPASARAVSNGYAFYLTTCARRDIYVYGVQIQYR